MEHNARRFFLDFSSDGNVILSAPKRTEFDRGTRFQDVVGQSDVTPEATLHANTDGFRNCVEFGGRLFFVNVQSVPITKVQS